MRNRYVGPRLVVLALGATFSTAALATPDIQKQFNSVAKVKPTSAVAKAQCESCHTKAPPKLNSFGTDMKALMGKQKSKTFTAAVWAKLGAKDSNKNKVPNKKEVAAGKLP